MSLLNVAVNYIHKFSMQCNMKLNPKKCKEMLINVNLGNNTVEHVITYELLGIIISNNLK